MEVAATIVDEGFVFDNDTTTKSYAIKLPEFTPPPGFSIGFESGKCVGPVTYTEGCDPAVVLPDGTRITDEDLSRDRPGNPSRIVTILKVNYYVGGKIAPRLGCPSGHGGERRVGIRVPPLP